MALISSLLLLLVLTILAVGMFRGMGMQEKMAGNVREKERALHAAQSAQQYAEYWLSNNMSALGTNSTCGGVVSATWASVQICSNVLPQVVDTGTVATVPWTIGSKAVGFTYQPVGMQVASSAPTIGSYAGWPTFYISNVGVSAAGANKEVYEIDAWSYGGANSTVAVVQSTYEITFKNACVAGC
jgi:type IV pilus assembly protein PilX